MPYGDQRKETCGHVARQCAPSPMISFLAAPSVLVAHLMYTEWRNEVLEASQRRSAAGSRELEQCPPLLIFEFRDHLRGQNVSHIKGSDEKSAACNIRCRACRAPQRGTRVTIAVQKYAAVCCVKAYSCVRVPART